MARISKGDFGKRHCNTEMSTVIPIDLKSESYVNRKCTSISYYSPDVRTESNFPALVNLRLLSTKTKYD